MVKFFAGEHYVLGAFGAESRFLVLTNFARVVIIDLQTELQYEHEFDNVARCANIDDNAIVLLSPSKFFTFSP